MKIKKFGFLMGAFVLSIQCLSAQNADQQQIRKIYDQALTSNHCYNSLAYLCKKVGARLSGSPQAAAAVQYGYQLMKDYGFDTVYLQPVMVPRWERGPKEVARVVNSKSAGTFEVRALALGNSVGSGPAGVLGELLEVRSFDELEKLGAAQVKGKIVFYNVAFDDTEVNTFAAYGKAAQYRYNGASRAAKLGAIGAVVRSMTGDKDDFPHTGSMGYELNVPKIPVIAVATNDAIKISQLIAKEKKLQFYFETHCQSFPDVLSYNVIGELRGTKSPETVIVVSGHLDSWDVGEGAHDDGAGVMQSVEVLRIFKAIGYKPNHTIRAVLFMNEENGLRGGKEYAMQVEKKQEKHLVAIESDRGGLTPLGFNVENSVEGLKKIQSWAALLEPYQLYVLKEGGSGADISPLKPQGICLIGLVVDSQRYFHFHHTDNDVFENVDKRELQLGAAAMGALIYLIDQHGL